MFHYASHHNVLEKVVMYESEQASREMRDSLKAKEDTIQSLTRELEELRGNGAAHPPHPLPHTSSRDKKEADMLRDDIQGKSPIHQLIA